MDQLSCCQSLDLPRLHSQNQNLQLQATQLSQHKVVTMDNVKQLLKAQENNANTAYPTEGICIAGNTNNQNIKQHTQQNNHGM